MGQESKDKVSRVLSLYSKMMDGQMVHKAEEAARYGVNEKSIWRDVEDIQDFLKGKAAETGESRYVIYDRVKKGYRIDGGQSKMLSNAEILAICKVLLDSRPFSKTDMDSILVKLIQCCAPRASRQQVLGLILNEEFHYVEPELASSFLDTMWNVGQAIQGFRYLEIDYLQQTDQSVVKRRIKPVAVLFSDSYFYVTAFFDDEELAPGYKVMNSVFPVIYRIDRIQKLVLSEEHFKIPYRDRLEESEFRKKLREMYGVSY